MKKLVVLLLAVAVGFSASAQIDRTKAPQPGPASTPTIGEASTFELKNGLKVIVVENHKLPRIAFSLMIDRDPIVEGEKAGYVSLTGDLLGAGTATKEKSVLDEEVDFMGARLSTSSTGVFVSGLSKYTDQLLTIMGDVVMNPAFNEEEFEKIKNQMISSVKSNSDDPDAISRTLRNAVVYGLDHPYGEPMTEATVEAISLEDCKAYYNSYFRPNAAYIVVVGDITPRQAKKKLKKLFKDWEPAELPVNNYDKTSLPAAQRVVMVDKPSAVQSVVWIGNVIDLPHGHPDIEALRLANQILGGGMSGRLFQNLREEHAYTYGAYSNFGVDKLNATISVAAKVRNEVTDSAVFQFLYEINRMRTELVSAEELQDAKASLTGSFGRSLEGPRSIANFALNIERYGLDEDYYNNYLQRLDAVTIEDVQRVAQKYLAADQLVISVVGKAQDVASKMSAYGTIEYFDAEGNPAPEPKFLFMPEGVTIETVLNNYKEACGGNAVDAITAIDKVVNVEIPGAPASIVVRTAKIAPNYSLSQQSMMGQVMEKMVLVKGKATSTSRGVTSELTGEGLEAVVKSAAYPMQIQAMLANPEDFQFMGQTLLDGKDVYQVEEVGEDADATLYFDVKTGLLYKEVSTMDTPQGAATAVVVYMAWKEVEGVLIASEVMQSFGPQSFKITLESVVVNDAVSPSIFK